MTNPTKIAERIKTFAREEGFARVGIAPAGPVHGADAFNRWLTAGCHGEMAYLTRNADKRFSPARLFEGASSVICLAVSYAPRSGGDRQADPTRPFVARYARGRDYHEVLKIRCARLMDRIRRIVPDLAGRAMVDTAPLAERSLAAAAGLGWIGRNGCLIVPQLGSYVVLAEIVCNLKLPADRPMDSPCGNCDACLRACPTGACRGDSLIDARRCLSYLTIEHRGPIDSQYWPLLGGRVFGCDSCQDVCPHNHNIPRGDDELTSPAERPDRSSTKVGQATIADILRWRREDYLAATAGSVTRRATCEMFIRNAIIAAGCSGRPELLDSLRLLRPTWPQFGEIIDWATESLSRSASRD